MVNLTERSGEKELLDADDISFADIKVCLKELNTINRLLGGHAITVSGLRALLRKEDTRLHIAEIGCGGGDNLHALAKIISSDQFQLTYTGIDLKQECIDFAKQQYPELKAEWIASDYSRVIFSLGKPDVIFSSLFCHHFNDDQLVEMMQWMNRNSVRGFYINDLQRSPVAYYLIKWLTAVFSSSYLVKNDGCISVARSFRKKEWINILKRAGINNYSIRWKWAFRYLIVFKK